MHLIKNENAEVKRNELPKSTQQKIKSECLLKYSNRGPRLFLQIDCFGPDAAGDGLIDPDSTGRGVMAGSTWELMHGTPVRILIADDYTDHKLIADLLTDAANWIRRDPDLLKRHHEHGHLPLSVWQDFDLPF